MGLFIIRDDLFESLTNFGNPKTHNKPTANFEGQGNPRYTHPLILYFSLSPLHLQNILGWNTVKRRYQYAFANSWPILIWEMDMRRIKIQAKNTFLKAVI